MKRFLPLVFILIILIPVVAFTSIIFLRLKPFIPFASYLLGSDTPTSYLILLGNDTEMRANGGFAGSYAKIILSPPVTITKPTISSSPSITKIVTPDVPVIARSKATWQSHFVTSPQISLDFQDIYVPDGQVKDYVEPPAPIQQAFGHGTWQLANSDWEPDFPTSSKAIRWFFEKGKEINPDILVILNLSTIKELVTVVGSFPVPEFNSTITSENLYLFLQGKAEVGFFPGSTQKKDALYAVGQAFFKKIKSLPLTQKIKLALIIYEDLEQKNIVVNSKNESFQKLLSEKNYDGKFASLSADSYSLVETNLGANKANAYVTRQTTHNISPRSHQVSVKFFNSSPEAMPNPPFHYGGTYVVYLRFYIPETATNIKITQNNLPYYPTATQSSSLTVTPIATSSSYPTTPIPNIIPKYGFTEIGFFHTTLAGNESTVDLSYELPNSSDAYSLSILKQNGMRSSPQQININNKQFKTDLKQDFFSKKIPVSTGM